MDRSDLGMMDTVDKITRSRIMSKVCSKGTGPERKFASLLKKAGMKGYKCHPKGVAGSPDVAFMESKVAVFIDSCFWHGCSQHLRRPNTNKRYWTGKIEGNVTRDRRTRRALRRNGWSVVSVWEHELKSPTRPLRRLSRIIKRREAA